MKKVFLPLFLLLSAHLYSCQWELPSNRIRRAPELMAAKLMKSPQGFFVQTPSKTTHIPVHEIDKKIRQMSKEELAAFLALNKVTLREHCQGYSVEANELGNGGGPITAAVFGCTTLVTGAVCTVGAAGAAFVTGHPLEAGAIALAGTKVTISATIGATEVGLWLPWW